MVCVGKEMRLLINAAEVATITDAELTAAGRIGLFASAPAGAGATTKVAYRNLVVVT